MPHPAALRAAGTGVSRDDFGSGDLSLPQRKSLPVSKLKVNRSFMPGSRPGLRW